MIETLRPMLLSELKQPFDRPGWGYEVKYDGWRMLAQCGALGVQLRTKSGADCTRWFPEVAATLATVGGRGMVLDGECCILDDHGRSDFNAFHARALTRRRGSGPPVTYCVFDCLVANGKSVMDKPLPARKKHLDKLRGLGGVLVVDYLKELGRTLYASAVLPLELEGMVAKRLAAPYVPGTRSESWIKVKRPGATPAQRFKR